MPLFGWSVGPSVTKYFRDIFNVSRCCQVFRGHSKHFCLAVCTSICHFVHLSVCPSVSLYVCQFVHLSVCPLVRPTFSDVCLMTLLSIHQFFAFLTRSVHSVQRSFPCISFPFLIVMTKPSEEGDFEDVTSKENIMR